MACCALLLVPRVARAASSGWNAETKTYTVNGTEGYRESVYVSEVKLPDGAILNLSNAGNYTGGDNEPPALFIVQGDLTIIGPKDKELSFSMDLLDFSLNDWGTKTQLTLTVKDMRFQQTDDGNDQTIVLNQIGRKASDDVSIDVKYSGDCALPRIVISDKTELTFSRAEDASEASTLELYDVSNEGNGNVEPGDGGSLGACCSTARRPQARTSPPARTSRASATPPPSPAGPPTRCPGPSRRASSTETARACSSPGAPSPAPSSAPSS